MPICNIKSCLKTAFSSLVLISKVPADLVINVLVPSSDVKCHVHVMIISTKMNTLLSLHYEAHFNPYNICWNLLMIGINSLSQTVTYVALSQIFIGIHITYLLKSLGLKMLGSYQCLLDFKTSCVALFIGIYFNFE